jgi:hypothetical protein
MKNKRRAPQSYAVHLLIAAPLLLIPAQAQAACGQWDMAPRLVIHQSNDTQVIVNVTPAEDGFVGKASYSQYDDYLDYMATVYGDLDGTLEGSDVNFTIRWSGRTGIGNSTGIYSGTIGPQGRMTGTSYDALHPESRANWWISEVLKCHSATAPASPVPSPLTPSSPAAKPLALGRVRLEATGTAPNHWGRSLCAAAKDARARNSPAAPGLERQCAAQPAAAPIDHGGLLAKGVAIADNDPLAVDLRAQQADDASRAGFDIGMAIAETDTDFGPGKQRIHDGLPANEQAGFRAAVDFSLVRNSNAKLAAAGAAIVTADPAVAEVRNAETNALFRQGFDIASGFFGDPKLGGLGYTSTGPGSLGVRQSLSAAGQRGFDASAAFHFGRNYAH